MPRTPILPNRSDNYRSSTTDTVRPLPTNKVRQLFSTRTAPWVICEPQPATVELERAGWISSTVLDAGCGIGEHTILLTRLGYRVLGIDFSPHAVEQARANAAEKGVDARFDVADAMNLGDQAVYQAVVDSTQVSESDIREAFGDGWALEALESTTYRGVVQEAQADAIGVPAGTRVDEPAWLARARRL
jgi:SAM-dependent methyltransferase